MVHFEKKYFRASGSISPWNGKYYIGFVLDAISKYLDLNVDSYYLGEGSCLESIRKASIVTQDGRKISVEGFRTDESFYLIKGFPEERDIEDFRENIQSILESIVLGNKPEKFVRLTENVTEPARGEVSQQA